MALNQPLFWIINFLSFDGCFCGQYISAYYRHILSDCNLFGDILSETTSSSLRSCCLHCMEDGRCLSVSYRRLDGTCVTHDVCPSECSGLHVEDYGWSLFCLEYSNWKPASCLEIKRLGFGPKDGVYVIYPSGQRRERVYCDMTTDEGGWMVFQQRFDGSVDFYRGWEEYKTGFGNPDGEYWLGNDILHDLTKQGTCKLRVDMVSHVNETGYAEYSNFTIGSEQDGYALNFSRYRGTALDALSYHKGQRFTTKDRDHDNEGTVNCAVQHHGAWWYQGCHLSNLNGVYGGSDHNSMWWGGATGI